MLKWGFCRLRQRQLGGDVGLFFFKLGIGPFWDKENRAETQVLPVLQAVYFFKNTGRDQKLPSYMAIWLENSPPKYFPPTCHFFRNL